LTDLFLVLYPTRLRNHRRLGQPAECHDIGLIYLSYQEYTWEENKFELWTELAYILIDITTTTQSFQIRDPKLNLHLQHLLPRQIKLSYFVQCCLLELCLLKLRNSDLGVGDDVIHSDEVVDEGWE
jgi:hypothetical protein